MRSAVFLLLILLPTASALSITEVFFNPNGSDNNREFVELRLDAPLNLSQFTLYDASSSDDLSLLQEKNSNYTLITEEGFNLTGINCSVYSAGSTIGNNLNNDADSILITNGSMNASFSYNTSLFLYQSGFSVTEKNGTIHAQEPSPCFERKISETGPPTTDRTNGMNTTEEDLCAHNLTIHAPMFVEDDTIEFTFHIFPEEPDNYSITYWVEEYFGTIVKDPYTTANTDQKRYTPSPASPYAIYRIKAKLKTGCNASVQASHLVAYAKKVVDSNSQAEADDERETQGEESAEPSSYADIIYIYRKDSIAFGSILRAKLSLFNRKSPSDATLAVLDEMNESITEVSFSFFRGSAGIISLEIPLPERCTKTIEGTLLLKAFDLADEKNITIMCDEPYETEDNEDEYDEKNVVETSTEKPTEQAGLGTSESEDSSRPKSPATGNIVYMNSSPILYKNSAAKSRDLVPYGIFFVCILTTLFVFRKKSII
ncbi:MAG: hypothetical protein ACOC32_00140 [Nanoarchaeota archaeon]